MANFHIPSETGEEGLLVCNVNYLQYKGTLYLTSTRLVWCRAGSSVPWAKTSSAVPNISLPFSHVTNLFRSKHDPTKRALLKVQLENKAYTFHFTDADTCWEERDTVHELLQSLVAKSHTTNTSTFLASQNRKRNTVSESNETARERAALLASDEELRKVHQQLVLTQIISEEQFWNSRKQLLEYQKRRSRNQSKGRTNELLSDVRPSSDALNAVHYRLTADAIRQIFEECPTVFHLYQQHVPERMSENEFWVQYFRSKFFHRDRVGRTTGLENQLITCEQQASKPEPPKKKARVIINPAVDLSNEIITLNTPTQSSEHLTLLRRYNNHSSHVLGDLSAVDFSDIVIQPEDHEGTSAAAADSSKQRIQHVTSEVTIDKVKRQQLAEETRLEELEQDECVNATPLNLPNHRRFFAGNDALNRRDLPRGTFHLFMHVVNELSNTSPKEWTTGGMSPQDARSVMTESYKELVLRDIQRETEKKGMFMASNVPDDKLKDVQLPQIFKTKVFNYFEVARELLRHFWSCYPITDKALGLKAGRLVKSISDLYDKVKTLKDTQKTELAREQWHQLDKLVNPILQSLSQAIEKVQTTIVGMNE